jgi:hypothetical protein
MSKWTVVAMGEVGLAGWRRQAVQPVARLIARKTGRPESEILSLFGGGFLLVAFIDFLRTVGDVIAAGRAASQPGDDRKPRQGSLPASDVFPGSGQGAPLPRRPCVLSSRGPRSCASVSFAADPAPAADPGS